MNLKETVLTVANGVGLPAVTRLATARHLRILCYHGVWVTPGYQYGDSTFISPEQFAERMGRLKRSGLPVLPLGEALDRLDSGDLPDAAVAITIDDGWVSTFTHMLPALEQHTLPATLYATTWYSGRALPVVNVAVDYLRAAAGRFDIDPIEIAARIDALPVEERLDALRSFGAELNVSEQWLELRQFNIMSADELAEAHQRGLDVQLHTHRHIDVEAKVDALPHEIAENRNSLENALGNVSLDHFCYPSGTFHPRAPSLLKGSGVRSATSTICGLNGPGADPYTLRRLLDARSISDAEFDAYLSGMLHLAGPVRSLLKRKGGQYRFADLRLPVSAALLALAGTLAAAE
jgi:peptidoglycan/xylan/chitin deacetylase (PgdA/CDA1 family)